ncbi:MAG: RNA polymerase sigma factor [Deltaproteobacteria bacterium]|nr:RNA polymerase sigma factor [Deltaproteobacteria bacterium]
MANERKGAVELASTLPTTDLPTSPRQQFERLVTDERERAVRLAYHMLGGDRAAAEDVAQEAFLRAYHALPAFRGAARLSTWFTRILLNQVATHRRRQWVRDRFLALWGVAGAPPALIRDPPPTTAASSLRDLGLRVRMQRALLGLPQGQQRVFVLVHLEGLTVAQTAEVLELAPGTVKSHLHRALKRLRLELDDLREVEP